MNSSRINELRDYKKKHIKRAHFFSIDKISDKKKGKNGFGYDPIFIPNKQNQTFGEMTNELKISMDHRFRAFSKIKKFFF